MMTAHAQLRFTVDEYLAWAQDHPGRYELFYGEVFATSPETVAHARVKGNVFVALRTAIRRARLPCHVLPNGITVRVAERTAYEPDAQVYCGSELPGDALEVLDPLIIVEVLSPSTRRIDINTKLVDYFRLPSVRHYLICDIAKRAVIQHTRGDDGTIVTRFVAQGAIALDPPGLELALRDIYEDEPASP